MSRIRRKAGWLGVMLAVFAFVMMPAGAIAGAKQDPGHAIKLPDGGPISGDPDEPHAFGNPPSSSAKHILLIVSFGPAGFLRVPVIIGVLPWRK